MPSLEYGRRDFIRLPFAVPVYYNFLSQDVAGAAIERVYEGTSQNIGSGGLLLHAELPDSEWLAPLLMRTMHIGVNLQLPDNPEPVKALCRVAWTSAVDSDDKIVLGLAFQEIARDDRDIVTRYIIKAQMPENE